MRKFCLAKIIEKKTAKNITRKHVLLKMLIFEKYSTSRKIC